MTMMMRWWLKSFDGYVVDSSRSAAESALVSDTRRPSNVPGHVASTS